MRPPETIGRRRVLVGRLAAVFRQPYRQHREVDECIAADRYAICDSRWYETGFARRLRGSASHPQHGRAAEASGAEIIHGHVRVRQRVSVDLRVDRYLRGQRHELLSVTPG